MHGVAGQSFGAFAVPGMQLVLEGMANDFVGKGLCGGELILRGQGRAARQSELHVILGNVALYGATSGSALCCRPRRASASPCAIPERWRSWKAWATTAANT